MSEGSAALITLYPLQLRWRRACGLESVHGHQVYLPALSSTSCVVDAGAHRGQFSLALLDRVPCRIVALEPNENLEPDAALGDRVSWHRVALGATVGWASLQLEENPEASSLRAEALQAGARDSRRRVKVTTLEGLVADGLTPRIDLLKLDVEGSEIGVLLETPPIVLQAIGQITVEFHSFILGEAESVAVERVKARLRELGFLHFHAGAPAEHETDTLFINKSTMRRPLTLRLVLGVLEPATSRLRRLSGRLRRVRRRLGGESGDA